MKNGTWRPTTHKYPSGGHRQFLRLLLLGLLDEKLKKNFRFPVYEFFLYFVFYYDYASIRNDRRARGSFCFLDQSPEPYRF